MSEQDVMAEMTEVLGTVFKDPKLQISRESTANQVPGWDSAMHMKVIAAVEAHFGVKFSLTDVLRFKNVGSMCDIVRAHSAKARVQQ